MPKQLKKSATTTEAGDFSARLRKSGKGFGKRSDGFRISFGEKAQSYTIPRQYTRTRITGNALTFEKPAGADQKIWKVLHDIKKLFDYSNKDMADVLGVSASTYKRWRKEVSLNLSSVDRVMRYTEILKAGHETFETRNDFRKWLTSPIRALGDAVPARLAFHEPGTQQVIDCIHQFNYGLYS